MGNFVNRIAKLTPEQRALLKLRRNKTEVTKSQSIPPRQGEGPWPCSIDQTAIWFIQQLNPGSAVYNILSGLMVKGSFDRDVLQRSLNYFFNRHESLRTIFKAIDGTPFQEILPNIDIPLDYLDFTHIPAERRAEAIRNDSRQGTLIPFDLKKGPLVRMTMYKMSEDEFALAVVLHHIITDWWSFQILIHELPIIYAAMIRDEQPNLPHLPIQFADYAVWRNEWNGSPAYQKQLKFWLEKVKGAPMVLELPVDKPRPPIATYSGDRFITAFTEENTALIRAMNQRCNTTTNMTLLAMFFVFVKRFAGVSDFLLATPSTDRETRGTERLYGYLLNTVLYRAELEGDPTFIELIDRTRRQVLTSMENKNLPFRAVVEGLNPPRDLSRMPIFQVEFLYVSNDAPGMNQADQPSHLSTEMPALNDDSLQSQHDFQLLPFELNRPVSPVDLQVSFIEHPGIIAICMEYNTDIFFLETVMRFTSQMESLLIQLINHPETPISQVPWLTEPQVEDMFQYAHGKPERFAREKGIHQWVAETASAHGEKTALIFGDKEFRYADLEARTDRLAKILLGRGIGTEDRVGICLERSPEMVIALLAVMKAGACYVPLDPSHPIDRLGYIAHDAQMKLLLVSEETETLWSDHSAVARLRMDSDEPTSDLPLPTVSGGERLAYIIYTSGSTGKPKGVAVTHRSVINFLQTMAESPGLSEADRLLAVTTLSFDIAGLELFLPLTVGATLVLADKAMTGDAMLLMRTLEEHQVNVMQATPATWKMLFAAGWQGKSDLRVLCGGEAFPVDLAQKLLKSCDTVWNVYGPTETTIWSARSRLQADDGVPIGMPLDNTSTYLVDPMLQIQPFGVPGELLIGGDGLARGYFRRPGLTAERFIPDPFSPGSGARLYRTGDLVKLRGDGQLEFMRRLDHQVKVRGYRIELGEIEVVLRRHPAIHEAAVEVRQPGGQGEAQLAAYYVLKPDSEFDQDELRQFMGQHLPLYMIPAFFMELEQLPLTPNNKLDRKALPDPKFFRGNREKVAPRTSTETSLLKIWAEVLGTQDVSIHDSFFEIGGHSLMATQIVSRIQHIFQHEIRLHDFFLHPSIAEQAQLIADPKDQTGSEQILKADRNQPLPASFSQRRLWFLDRLTPSSPTYNVPIALLLEGPFRVAVAERALEELMRRHEVLRTHFAESNGQPIQIIGEAGEPPLHFRDVSQESNEQKQVLRQEWLQQWVAHRIHLDQGPLWIAAIQKESDQLHVLVITMHHIISDAWSQQIFMSEFTQLYRAYDLGLESPFADPAIQFADYAIWQKETLNEEILTQQVNYWQEQLADLPPYLDMPTNRPRPAEQTYVGKVQTFLLEKEWVDALRAHCQAEGGTLFMGLLAALSALLSRYSGQHDLCIGTTIANRNQAQLESLIGFFINSLALRMKPESDQDLPALIRQARSVALGAYAHQDLPFEQVVEAIQPPRDRSRTPLFQVTFSLVDGPENQAESTVNPMPGVEMSGLAADAFVSKYDMTFFLTNSAEGHLTTIEYNTDLFDDETVARIFHHFRNLLQEWTSQPGLTLSELRMMAPEETNRLLSEWSGTAAALPSHLGIHGLFDEQATNTPQATALISDEDEVSYAALQRRADVLAGELLAAGVTPGTMVGLCLQPGIDQVASALAILKSGASYVPFDPEYPAQRIAHMLEDTQLSALITSEELVDVFPSMELNFLNLILVDEVEDGSGEVTRIAVDVPLEAPAYVVYTSGSTGIPKGVVVSHRSVIRLVRETAFAEFKSDASFLQAGSLSFDASTFELWGSLLNGAKLILTRTQTLDRLPAVIRDRQATVFFLTTQLFNLLVDEHLDCFQGVVQVLVGGEVASIHHMERFMEGHPNTELIHCYGPTENTTFTTTCPLNREGMTGHSAAIGRPITNSSVYVVDPQMNLVPHGVHGELWVGGLGLASGYHRRPALTAERFVPHPFASQDQAGERLYRSGDVVKWLASGLLDFVGRTDSQIKIRGYRIEPGEIEQHLVAMPAVIEARVLPRRTPAGALQLVGFAIAEADTDSDALLDALRTSLPAYMIPAGLVLVDHLPMTVNRKLDQEALLAMVDQDFGHTDTYQPPETPTQEQLAELWCGLLQVEKVGIHDHFFDIGGHSLLAVQLGGWIKKTFEIDLELSELFNHPTIAECAAMIDAGTQMTAVQLPAIEAADRSKRLPLSFSQERLWFVDQLTPGSTVYNIYFAFHLEGRIDRDLIRSSFQSLVDRHESLRTRFGSESGQPYQIVDETATLVFELHSHDPEDADDELAACERTLQGEQEHVFSLSDGPLFRVVFLELASDKAFIVFNMHHIISDAWSLNLLFAEFSALYQAQLSQTESPLQNLPLQYADYANWQKQWLTGDVLQRQMDYWQETLLDTPSSIDLPLDRPRPIHQSFNGSMLQFDFDQELSGGLRELCTRENATMFMGFLAGLAATLARYSGQDDMCIGTTIANRNHPQVENMIGFFINSLVMRLKTEDDPNLVTLIRRTREVALGAYSNQDLPFERVVEHVQPERDLSRSPIFQVAFTMLDAFSGGDVGSLMEGVEMRQHDFDTHTSKYDLTLFIHKQNEDHFAGAVEYNTDLFDENTIQQMFGHYRQLMKSWLRHPNQPLSQVTFLDQNETARLHDRGGSVRPLPEIETIHGLFAKVAEAGPEAIALIEGGHKMTYGELDRRANHIAFHLQESGVSAGDLVGLCLHPGFDLIAAIIGILKTGASYVPLDSEYPQARLADMLSDTGLGALITEEKMLDVLPAFELNFLNTLVLDQSSALIDWDGQALASHQLPGDLGAYVMYTSGSTGRPKGVVVTHRNVIRLVKHNHFVTYDSEQIFLQAGSISFDASTFEIWGALLNGAKLVLDADKSVDRLPTIIREQGATTFFLTAQLFNMLVDEELDCFEGVRQLLVGGDQVSVQHAQRLRSAHPHIQLKNGYGPTENTTFSVVGDLTGEGLSDHSAAIGRPIENSCAFVVDQTLGLVPDGVHGELLVGGAGLARGYLNRPGLTAERFVPNPFADQAEAGSRLYHTGDVVRWLANGLLDFVGRTDHQVKIRGFRIEPGEIEFQLRANAQVEDAYVRLLKTAAGDKRLIAYVATGETELSTQSLSESLRSHLQEKLPAYMVPAAIIALPSFPLTTNGKVKVDELPLPGSDSEDSVDDGRALTPTEMDLQAIWSHVLEIPIETIRAKSDFFHLGGHSLLATLVLSRIRESMGQDLPLRVIFEQPSLEDLARYLNTTPTLGKTTTEPPIVAVPRDQAIPLSFAQERLWFLDRLDPNSAVYNVPLAYHLQGRFEIKHLRASLESLIVRHEALRTRFEERDGTPVQIIDPVTALAFNLHSFDHLEESERAVAAQAALTHHTTLPFDLERGPLFRADLFKLNAENHLLLLNLHHIISDAWSLKILLSDLQTLFAAAAADRSADLAPLNLHYADFAAWQRQWLRDDVLASQMDYWQNQLSGCPGSLELPTDRPRPTVQTYHGNSVQFELNPGITRGVEQLVTEEGASLFMVLNAAFQALLSRYSGQSDFAVGTAIANRNRKAVESMIGFFVNTLVLRADVSGNPTFRELIGRSRQTALDAYAHQDVPFEAVVEQIQPERDRSRSPLFQVLFSIENTGFTSDQEAITQGPLAMKPHGFSYDLAKYDLSLYMDLIDGRLIASFNYNTDLFDESRIIRMSHHLNHLLEAWVTLPERRLGDIPMLAEDEANLLRHEWSGQHDQPHPEGTIHGLFDEVANRQPTATALIEGAKKVSYGALAKASQRTAAALARAGVRPGDAVGLCMQPGAVLVETVLAILKNGAAYVPLDPDAPSERLGHMIRDAALRVVITQPATKDRLAALNGFDVALLTSEELDCSQDESAFVAFDAPAETDAYIMYTSGSTGRPKGVAVSHANVIRLVKDTQYVNFHEEAIFIQAGSIAFDAATFELWGSLLNGARLVLAPAKSIDRLPELIQQQEVNTCFLTTQLFNYLVDEHPECFGTIRQLLVGGEQASVHHMQRFLESHPDTDLIHVYGPTENTTFSTFCKLRDEGMSGHSAAIGRPISHSTAYVVDTTMQLTPIGVNGELLIGGAGLARGYNQRPALTAAAFVPNPFAAPDSPGTRLYRSGDLVRWTESGQIDFVGRRDQQLKIRGFRIEPGEIEHHLRSHGHVDDVFIHLVQTAKGDKRLVAYVTEAMRESDNIPLAQVLRGFLTDKLPAYMVPAAIMVLDRLPLNANGKVASDLLPLPSSQSLMGDLVDRPLTVTETELREIWAEVLECEAVSIHAGSDFFALGGHSLLATLVTNRIRRTMDTIIALEAVFEFPRLEGLARHIQAAKRQSLIEEEPPIVAVARDQIIPLSYAQERLWFLDRLEPGTAVYNVPLAYRLSGPLDYDRLRTSFSTLIDRHEALRTRFVMREGNPHQHIDHHQDLALEIHYFEELASEQRLAAAQSTLVEESMRPFDLEQGPLFRADLFVLSQRDHLLLLNLHHIISDAWSLKILLADFQTLYFGEPTIELAPLPLQYADFSTWQRNWLSGEVLDRQMAYWRDQLADMPGNLALPTDRPRPKVQTHRGDICAFELPESLTPKVEALLRSEGASPFMVLGAAFQVLLGRYSGQRDFGIGTVIANRNRQAVESMIGFFVNTLVLRADINGNPSFRQMIGRARQTALDGFAHQDVPFEAIVERLQPERDTSRSPLFQVLFSIENTGFSGSQSEVGSDRLAMAPHGFDYHLAKFDLALYMDIADGHIQGSFNYNIDLFEAHTIRRMVGHLASLLEGLVMAPDQPIATIPMMTDEERERVVHSWNSADLAYDSDNHLISLFEDQVGLTPDAMAVEADDHKWTYAELDREAERMAHGLVSQGIGSGDLVGVCLQRGSTMIAAMLGILKTGAGYVPLDPDYPSDRLRFSLEDCKAAMVITDHAHASLLDNLGTPILVAEESPTPRSGDPVRVRPSVTGGDLAYVLFTSGSTGKPKGVAISQQNVVAMLAWAKATYEPKVRARVLAATSICFDLSVFEIFLPLTTGGTAVIVRNALALLEEPVSVSLINTVPSAIAELERASRIPTSVHTINLAGEPLPGPLVDRLYRLDHVETVYNLYGPSEDTTYSTFTAIERGESRPPIGRPLPNSQTYLTDAWLHPVAEGCQGELCLAGDGVAVGYLDRAGLTAERFVPDPFGKTAGSRIYKTGDLARYRPDGVLDFMGRLDHQIKLRGFRIELDEIRARLMAHTAIRDALALVTPLRGSEQLAAYVVFEEAGDLSVSEMKQHLADTLPNFMVPVAFKTLTAFPLTPNGKIDRKALPPIRELASAETVTYVAPSSNLEQSLAKIWREVLDIKQVGIHDNFFDMGGHSLAMARVQYEIRDQIGKDIPILKLYEHTTIATLTSYLQEDSRDSSGGARAQSRAAARKRAQRRPKGRS